MEICFRATPAPSGPRPDAGDEAIRGFQYLADHGVLICNEHRYAVRNLKTHLDRSHSHPAVVKKAVIAHFAAVHLGPPENASLPEAGGPPFECLSPPLPAFLCDGDEDGRCGVIRTRRENIAQHCNQVHDWTSSIDDREHWKRVLVQSFCSTSGKQRYFIVCTKEQREAERQDTLSNDDQKDVDIIMQDFDRLESQRQKALETLDEEMAQTDQTGWWKKTGWVEHLKGSTLRHLSHAARLPEKQDTTLVRARQLVEMCVEQSVKGLMILPHELRRWLKSVRITEVEQRPMGRLQNESSQNTYALYAVRLICYCLRVLRSEDSRGKAWTCEAEEVFEDASSLDEGGGEKQVEEEGKDDMYDARRLFPWREGQKECVRRLWGSIESGATTDDQMAALLKLFETLIFQKIYGDVFQSPLIHFLAVLGIDQENHRLRQGNDFSYMLAGVVYCTRVTALEILLPGERRSMQGEAEFKFFLEQRREYLADGTMSPMSTMISLLAYGKYLAHNHGNAGSIFWEKGDRVMRLHSNRIVMDQFREMVRRAIADAEDVLWRELLWDAERFEIDLDELTDDFTFRLRGAYFVNNTHNKLEHKWKWTLKRMKETKRGRRLRKDQRWHRMRVMEYLRRANDFRRLLLFSVHTTHGQPKRGSEMLGMRFKNGFLQDRNVFVLDGIVMLVSRYYKSQSQWDVPKAVPSFLPWRVGQIMAVYLAYVQPFAERLSVAMNPGSGWEEYIWGDTSGPWDTSRLTTILQRRTGADLGVELGTLDYRHVAVGIGRKFVGDEFARGYKEEIGEVEEPEVEDEDPLEQSAGRSSATGASRYAVSTNIVRHLSQRNIDTFRPLSESWHRFLGLATRKEDGWSRKRSAERTSIQAPASKRMRKAVVITGLATPGKSAASAVAPPPLLRTDPTLSEGEVLLPPSTPSVVPVDPSRPNAVGQDERGYAVRKALGMVEGTEITYRSPQQAEALERIINRSDSALAVILPTGGGKSLLYTGPACLPDPGVTIVIVPYRQLTNETVQGAKAVGIDCVEWTHGTGDPATIVVVSADKLNDRFFGYASLLASKGLLRRVFVDECHLAITAHSWRKRLVELARVQTLEVPLIMLTATLPVLMESDLEVTMMASVQLEWIRACTARRTTRYIVRANIKDGELQREALKVCRKRLALLKHGMKLLVYCRFRSECEEMAVALECGFFYAGAGSNEEVLERWRKEGGCVVATSALGTGVNYPGIEMVVHAGMPYGLIDFAQESGRAGRGGEDVDSVILIEKGWEARERTKRQAKRQDWSRDERELVKFVNTDGCRRRVLAEYYDEGEPVDCISGEMARCDRCGSGVTDWERSQRNVAEEKGMVLDTLDQVANGCTVCWVTAAINGTGDWLHNGRTCERRQRVRAEDGEMVDLTEQACERFRQTVWHLDGSKTCFNCGISQKLCNTKEKGQGGCQWPRVAIPLVRIAMGNTVGRNIIRQAGHEGGTQDWVAYALWLGQPHRLRLWKELVSNLMVVIKDFLIYCRQEMEDRMNGKGGSRSIAESEGEEVEVVEADTDEGTNIDNGLVRHEAEEITPVNSTYVEKEQARVMGPLVNVEQLRQMIDEWKQSCVLCKIHGRSNNAHQHWTECRGVAQEREKMEEAVKLLQEVEFAAFSQCKWCNRSQAICEVWERRINAAGRTMFQTRPGRDCRYGRWLLEAAAGLLAFRVKDGLDQRRTTDPSFLRLKEEMGKKLRRGEVEFSGMFMYFYRWV